MPGLSLLAILLAAIHTGIVAMIEAANAVGRCLRKVSRLLSLGPFKELARLRVRDATFRANLHFFEMTSLANQGNLIAEMLPGEETDSHSPLPRRTRPHWPRLSFHQQG